MRVNPKYVCTILLDYEMAGRDRNWRKVKIGHSLLKLNASIFVEKRNQAKSQIEMTPTNQSLQSAKST